jgi:hypothetical protein
MTRATSIAVRLRRIEVTYVNVPVTEEIAASLSAQAGQLITAACLLGESSEVKWPLESKPTIDAHPIQNPQPTSMATRTASAPPQPDEVPK